MGRKKADAVIGAVALGLQLVVGGLLHLMDFLRHRYASATFWLADTADFYRQHSALRFCFSGVVKIISSGARTQFNVARRFNCNTTGQKFVVSRSSYFCRRARHGPVYCVAT